MEYPKVIVLIIRIHLWFTNFDVTVGIIHVMLIREDSTCETILSGERYLQYWWYHVFCSLRFMNCTHQNKTFNIFEFGDTVTASHLSTAAATHYLNSEKALEKTIKWMSR